MTAESFLWHGGRQQGPATQGQGGLVRPHSYSEVEGSPDFLGMGKCAVRNTSLYEFGAVSFPLSAVTSSDRLKRGISFGA